MTDALIVFCTAASEEEGAKLAEAIVAERLSACVNLLPGIRSIYRWEGKLEQANETLLLIKTSEQKFPALRERIAALHSYQTPEILAMRVADGLPAYLDWIRESL